MGSWLVVAALVVDMAVVRAMLVLLVTMLGITVGLDQKDSYAPGAQHCGRYGQEGQLCSAEARTAILVVRVTCSVFQRNVCSTVDPTFASVSVDTFLGL